jgi:hypothetical protein
MHTKHKKPICVLKNGIVIKTRSNFSLLFNTTLIKHNYIILTTKSYYNQHEYHRLYVQELVVETMHIILWVSKNQIAPISLSWTQHITCSFLIDPNSHIEHLYSKRLTPYKTMPLIINLDEFITLKNNTNLGFKITSTHKISTHYSPHNLT